MQDGLEQEKWHSGSPAHQVAIQARNDEAPSLDGGKGSGGEENGSRHFAETSHRDWCFTDPGIDQGGVQGGSGNPAFPCNLG